MFNWYAVNTYSGHEKKVKANLEQRAHSLGQERAFRRVVIPTESVVEARQGQKVQVERRTLPGYVLVNMDLSDESWTVVKGTPGVIAFVGPGPGAKPVPLAKGEVERLLHLSSQPQRRQAASFQLGDTVKIVSGPLTELEGTVVEVNEEQQRLKVSVLIFERQTPTDLGFGQVRKID